MPRKDMKSALKGSLIKEEQAIKDRFEKAETVFSKEKKTPAQQVVKKEERELKPTIPTELKVIRDSFTMPQGDYELINQLKKRSIKLGVEITKSEIIRAGLKSLELMDSKEFLSKISLVEKIKTGRPKQIS
jgi:hypothetical protein